MDTKAARKILGKEADNIDDNDLSADIRVAELMKELFFEEFRKIAKNEIDNIVVTR